MGFGGGFAGHDISLGAVTASGEAMLDENGGMESAVLTATDGQDKVVRRRAKAHTLAHVAVVKRVKNTFLEFDDPLAIGTQLQRARTMS